MLGRNAAKDATVKEEIKETFEMLEQRREDLQRHPDDAREEIEEIKTRLTKLNDKKVDWSEDEALEFDELECRLNDLEVDPNSEEHDTEMRKVNDEWGELVELNRNS